MKLLELRFKNLNSLYGGWCIDFTDPAFVSNGIFAITGATGAGKSTILDALSLALYGSTPRLGRVTKRSNEILSRNTGECYSELLFASGAGRFRCRWEQRRAGKKAAGALQDPRHEISDGDTGVLIEEKKSRVPAVVEVKTGMDFDRFTRSTLLAQGGFDSFLRAESEEKSKILEQITGTKIYTEISQRTHLRLVEEREKVSRLEAEYSGLVLLEEEEEKRLRETIAEYRKSREGMSEKLAVMRKAMEWLRGVDALKSEIASLSEEAVTVTVERSAFAPEQERLMRSLKAVTLEGAYVKVSALRREQREEAKSLEEERKLLDSLIKEEREAKQVLAAVQKQSLAAKEEAQKCLPLLRRVRSLDERIADRRGVLTQEEEKRTGDQRGVADDRERRERDEQKRETLLKERAVAEGYLSEHSADEWLVTGFAGVREQVATLSTLGKRVLTAESDSEKMRLFVEKTKEKVVECKSRRKVTEKEVGEAAEHLGELRQSLELILGGKLLRERRVERDNLMREMILLTRIAELEEERGKLEDGRPCPLCGSEDHPFARGNVPGKDETEVNIKELGEMIAKAEETEALIVDKEKRLALLRERGVEDEKNEEAARLSQKNSEENLATARKRLKEAQNEETRHKEEVADTLKEVGVHSRIDDPESLLEELGERLGRWNGYVEGVTGSKEKIVYLEGELKRLDAIIEVKAAEIKERQSRIDALKAEDEGEQQQRAELFGKKDPEREEKILNTRISEAEEAVAKAQIFHVEAKEKTLSAETRAETLVNRLEQRELALIEEESKFAETLNRMEFSDEEAFLKARLDNEEREALQSRGREVDEKVTAIESRLKDRKERLEVEEARKITDRSLPEIEAQGREIEEEERVVTDRLAALEHRLLENEGAKRKSSEREEKIKAQRREYLRWQRLHTLIGSSDGKKFRNYAQGLTFDIMVSHANCQLATMTDRYILIRNRKEPLELDVIDNYQGGEVRSTKNLSGGESFIVSLTLALGLSAMGSAKVRIDSLFLDEGFGTLDEESLETALETLAGLRQEGKLIGIISHISALKERIPTQINVSSRSGGKSLLVGPGCVEME